MKFASLLACPWGKPLLFLLLTLAACGDGSDGDDTPPPDVGTLAYVETECRDTQEGFFERQALRIRQGDRKPVTVFETPGVGPITGIGGLCWALTNGRFGDQSISRQALQSVAVSADGMSVAFEVNDEFSALPPLPLNLPAEQKGIFWVYADGTGLRRLAPPSRQRFFYVNDLAGVVEFGGLSFSSDGRTIAFVDKGPDAVGHEADQVVTVDVATGARTQITRLPLAVPGPGWPVDAPTIVDPRFIDERTIRFYSSANPGGLNPEGLVRLMTTKTDGSGFQMPVPIPVALPGGTIELRFVITGDRPQAIVAAVPGTPINDPPLASLPPEIQEVFAIDEGKNVLQLTNFRRADTLAGPVDADGKHLYFRASADPLGTNPSASCQIFSIDWTGADLRQLTNFHETEHSVEGCLFDRFGRGCAVGAVWQDPRTGAVLFYSNCDPVGTNPNGGQIFAMRPDGSGLRQLTDSSGLVREADGRYSGELPGPWAYGPYAH